MCSCVCFWYEIIQGAEGIHIQPGFQTERKVKRQAAYLFLHLLPPHFQKSRLYSIVFACTYCQLPKDMSNPDSLVCLDSSHPNSWILSASWNQSELCWSLPWTPGKEHSPTRARALPWLVHAHQPLPPIDFNRCSYTVLQLPMLLPTSSTHIRIFGSG